MKDNDKIIPFNEAGSQRSATPHLILNSARALEHAEVLLKSGGVTQKHLALTLDDFGVTKRDPLAGQKDRVVILNVDGADPHSRVIQSAVLSHITKHQGLIFILTGKPDAIDDFLKPVSELRSRFSKPAHLEAKINEPKH